MTLLTGVKKKYWPIDGRRLATLIYEACQNCFNANPRSQTQKISILPPKRILQSPLIWTMDIDFCGTIYVHYTINEKVPKKVIYEFV